MAQSHAPAPVDPEALARASANWNGFVHLIKYSLIAIIAVLALMAVFLV
jgi:hypothetical protein